MNQEALEFLERRLAYLEMHKERLTIDADVHLTNTSGLTGELCRSYEASPNYYHGRPISAEDALAEMALAGVDMALVWQNPAATPYTDDPRNNYEALLAANRYIFDSARRYPESFIPAGWTDPKALGVSLALELVDRMVLDFGFSIVKMNPAQNHFPINSEPVRTVLERIVELGAVPAFHFGADTPFTPARGLESVTQWHPDHPVLAVHMGGGGAGYVEADELCRQARELGLRQPNIRFIMSAKRDTHIESDLITWQLAGEPFCRHLFCGSDAPYGRMAWNFGGFRGLLDSLAAGQRHPDSRVRENPVLFTRESTRHYLGRNMAEFVIEACRRLLQGQAGQAASARGGSA